MKKEANLKKLKIVCGLVFGLFATPAFGIWGFIVGCALGVLSVRFFYWWWVFSGNNSEDV